MIRAEAMQDLAQNTREAIRVGFAEYKKNCDLENEVSSLKSKLESVLVKLREKESQIETDVETFDKARNAWNEKAIAGEAVSVQSQFIPLKWFQERLKAELKISELEGRVRAMTTLIQLQEESAKNTNNGQAQVLAHRVTSMEESLRGMAANQAAILEHVRSSRSTAQPQHPTLRQIAALLQSVE